MGFNNDTEFGESKSNALLEKQIAQNEAELESKRKSLFDTRLSIVKSSGRESWATPTPAPSPQPTPAPAPTPKPPFPPRPKSDGVEL